MKYLLLLIIISVFITLSAVANVQPVNTIQMQPQLKQLEQAFDGKIGVYAMNTGNNQIIAYRADKRFPIQSTMKLISVAALLRQSDYHSALLKERIPITKNDLMTWCPITKKYLNTTMTLDALAEAAMSYSDNAAVNLIIKKLGGVDVITHFAHSIGNKSFNLKHYDGEMNSNPAVVDDTATPKDMAFSLQKLTLGNVLAKKERTQLVTWMRNNTTGYQRIRAGVPIGWVVADKTGSGDYGVDNDIGILWSPACKPIVLAIYTVRDQPNAKSRDDIIAATTKIVLNAFSKTDSCFKKLFH